MAEVYRAYQGNLDRHVAIKVLHAFLADDPDFKSRFEREAQNIAKLKHPNIVQVYDFEYDPDAESYYMVMELVDGVTLKDRLADVTLRGELMPVTEALRIVKEAAAALAYAHSRSMIHRDVKPANLMLDHDNRLVLTDFGIAKILTGAQVTASGGMVGTPAYMSPEQGLGEAGDERSDLYSLGIILFQLLTGRLPYDADTPLAIVLKHLNSPTPTVRDFNPALPETLDRIVQKAIAKDAADRYQTAADLIEDLNRFERSEGGLLALATAPPLAVTIPPRAVNTDTVPAPEPSDTLHLPGMPSPVRRRNGTGRLLLGMGALLLLGGLFGVASGFIQIPGITLTASTPTTAAAERTDQAPTGVAQAATSTPNVTEAAPTVTVAPTTSVPTLTPTPSTPVAVMRLNVEVRQGPGTQFARMATAPQDSALTILGRSEDNLWFRVMTMSGLPGWVQVSVVDAFGNVAAMPVFPAPSLTPSLTPTASVTPTGTATATPTPTITPTPSPSATSTLNVSATAAALTQIATAQMLTAQACEWNYAVKELRSDYPTNADDLDQVPANTDYVLDIVLVNNGSCAWGVNTTLAFEAGDELNARPVIFFQNREAAVPVGSEAIIEFRGRAPGRGGIAGGTWVLRTPQQIAIGEPLDIRIQVYETGG